MPPANAMSWIAGWFPLLSFVVSFLVYYIARRTWLATLVTIVPAFVVVWVVFTLNFWPWLLLYLLLGWLGCWAAHRARARKQTSASR